MPALVYDAALPLPIMNRSKATAPAVQAVISPPKEVRFQSDKKLATSSRERTTKEAWSFYWFEIHCNDCYQCFSPYAVYKRGDNLCSKGEALARDMCLHVFMRNGEIYERLDDPHASPDRVELPHNYHNVPGQLKAMEKIAKSYRRRSHRPVVQHDQNLGHRVDERKREDRYYQERILREEKPRSEKTYHKSHRSEKAELVTETLGENLKYDDKERPGRRRHTHSAEYRREQGRDSRKETYVQEERSPHEKDCKRGNRNDRDRRPNKDNEIEVEVETIGGEKRYRTEIRKPDKEHKKVYYR